MSGIRNAILALLASPPPPLPVSDEQAVTVNASAATSVAIRRMGYFLSVRASVRAVERDESGGVGRVGRQPDLGERGVLHGGEDPSVVLDGQAEQNAEREPEERAVRDDEDGAARVFLLGGTQGGRTPGADVRERLGVGEGVCRGVFTEAAGGLGVHLVEEVAFEVAEVGLA